MANALRGAALEMAGSPLILAVTLLVTTGACERRTVELPTSRQVDRWYPELFFENAGLRGLYANHDTDAMIFLYDTADSASLLEQVLAGATATGWSGLRRRTMGPLERAELVRVDPPGGPAEGHSLEVMRLVHCGRRILIAAVQDDREAIPSAPSAEGPNRWAEAHFWPLFEEHVSVECGSG
jgi:hypothetical protein